MSRIDISVREKKSGNLIANRGFCRDSHLSYFCANSKDEKIRDFARELFIGVSITTDNIEDFLKNLKHASFYLEHIEKSARDTEFSFYNEEMYHDFLVDLKDGFEFLKSLNQKEDLQNLEVSII